MPRIREIVMTAYPLCAWAIAMHPPTPITGKERRGAEREAQHVTDALNNIQSGRNTAQIITLSVLLAVLTALHGPYTP